MSETSGRALLTGASGLIGRHAVRPLLEAGFEVHGLSRSARRDGPVQWHCGDLLNADFRKRLFAETRPDYLLHLAWDARPGTYLDDDSNFAWLAAGLDMLDLFRRHGGKRAALAGTCLEYAFTGTALREDCSRAPVSVYARCKDSLNRLAALFCEKNGISFAWGRIFYVFGPGEQAGRLTPSVMKAIRAGERLVISGGPLIRDYMYSEDVGAGFAALLRSSVEGEVNVSAGVGVRIADYCRLLAEKIGGDDSVLEFDDRPGTQPPYIVGDNRRLREEVGFAPAHDLATGIESMLAVRDPCAL